MYITNIEKVFEEFLDAMPEIIISDEMKAIIDDCYKGNKDEYIKESFFNFLEQVVEDEKTEEDFILKFDATIEINQKIKIINKNLTKDEIIYGLKNGNYLTTTWISENQSSYIEDENGLIIALILSQETEGDYKNFK